MGYSKEDDNDDTNLLIWGVDPNLKSRFKARCAQEKRTMKEVILEFLAEFAARK